MTFDVLFGKARRKVRVSIGDTDLGEFWIEEWPEGGGVRLYREDTT